MSARWLGWYLRACTLLRATVALTVGALVWLHTQVIAGASISFATGPVTQGFAGPIALADFNGDGKADILLWRNAADGRNAVC